MNNFLKILMVTSAFLQGSSSFAESPGFTILPRSNTYTILGEMLDCPNQPETVTRYSPMRCHFLQSQSGYASGQLAIHNKNTGEECSVQINGIYNFSTSCKGASFNKNSKIISLP